MNWLRALSLRLNGVFRPGRRDHEIADELECHLQLHIDDNLGGGMSPEEARRQALSKLGGIEYATHVYRERITISVIDNFLRDTRYGLRTLGKSPGYALIVLLSLALGIGATTAVFSVIYGVLVDPYPYPASAHMVHLLVEDTSGNLVWPLYSGTEFQQVQQASSIENAVGYRNREFNITGKDLPEAIVSTDLTSNGFDYFGVHTLSGRGLQPSDVSNGQVAQPVTVLAYRFWRRYYSGDPHIVGRTIQLNHVNYTIVGVAPPRFTWGNGDLFLPAIVSDDPTQKLEINLRLRDGVGIIAAQAELGSLLLQFAKQYPQQFPRNFRPHLTPLNEIVENQVGPILYLLLGAVGLLLVIGCGNASILSMARGTARKQELAIKSALGASRFRLLSSLLAEAFLLSVAGAGVGILLAYQLVRLIRRWLPETSFPSEAAIHINLPVLAFCVALSLVCGILSGLSGALEFSRPEIAQVLRANTSKVAGRIHGHLLHRALIAGQVALTVVLLSGAGTAMQAFLRIVHRSLGYDPHNVMAIGFPIDEHAYPTWEARRQYLSVLQDAMASTPGVASAAISLYATPPDSGWDTSFLLHGNSDPESQRISAHFVSGDYFHVLRIPLQNGRLWTEAETARGAQVGIINQTMKREFFASQDPIGQFIRLPKIGYLQYSVPAPKEGDWIEIIGVVQDAVNDGLDRPVKPAIYTPFSNLLARGTEILVRTNADPLMVLPAIQRKVQIFNANQTTEPEPHDLEEWMRREPAWARSVLIGGLFSAFSLLALVLSAVGLFSVVAYSVAQRTNEFGVRIALGARRGNVLKVVLGSIATTVGTGLGSGLVLTFLLHRFTASLLVMQGSDGLVFVGAAFLLIAVATVACVIPAHRATTVDPVKALRYG
jgi:predicted permease